MILHLVFLHKLDGIYYFHFLFVWRFGAEYKVNITTTVKSTIKPLIVLSVLSGNFFFKCKNLLLFCIILKGMKTRYEVNCSRMLYNSNLYSKCTICRIHLMVSLLKYSYFELLQVTLKNIATSESQDGMLLLPAATNRDLNGCI